MKKESSFLPPFLGLDIGKKRTGIAISDTLGMIASGVTAIETKNLFTFLTKQITQEKIEVLVFGNPATLHNTVQEQGSFIETIIKKIQEKFPTIKIIREDERFSSKIVRKDFAQFGFKKSFREEKGKTDIASATYILQGFLDKINKH